MRDARGVWTERLARKRDAAACTAFGRLMQLEAFLRDVQLGGDCAFYGRTLFHRAAGSTMAIGGSCVFRSAPWSSYAGIERACMVSTLLPGASLTIGSTCGFSGTVVAAAENIVIGDRVLCGVNSTITDTDWHGVDLAARRAVGRSAPVSIQDDVWIGMGAVVLKGVTIGRGSVVAAGSVVTRSLPPMVVAGGNPARVIREL